MLYDKYKRTILQFLVYWVCVARFERWGTAAHGKPTLEQVYPGGLQPPERAHAGAEAKREEEGAAEANCYALTVSKTKRLS